jgi:hypothetical protein
MENKPATTYERNAASAIVAAELRDQFVDKLDAVIAALSREPNAFRVSHVGSFEALRRELDILLGTLHGTAYVITRQLDP